MLSLDLHTKSADQPWPSECPFSSIYGILRGVSCSYTLKGHKIVSNPWKFMEISIHTSSESGLVREYYSCGLEYYLCPYKVNTFMGDLMGQFALYLASNTRMLYRSTWPTFLINYTVIPEDKIETKAKPIPQSIARKLLEVLIRSAWPN